MTQQAAQPTPPPRLFDETYLRKLDRLAILSRRAMAGQIQGERRSPKRGQSVEFADYRPYTEGDDFRRIDWNAYARLERFFIKLFVEEEDLLVHLLVDASRSMDWGEPNKFAYAVRAAGALGYIALAGLDRLTVSTLGARGQLTPRRGRPQALPLFRFLQDVQPQGEANLAAALTSYAGAARQPGPLLLISDLMDDGWSAGLRALAGRGFDVTVLHILAPAEVDPQLSGDLNLIDSETDAAIEITADFGLLQRYRDSVTAWQTEIREFCTARAIQYVSVTTSLPFDELLFSLLRRRGVLA